MITVIAAAALMAFGALFLGSRWMHRNHGHAAG
jgi:hypothetical protein